MNLSIMWTALLLANAVFTTKKFPTYDDIPEIRYHFPKTYYKQAMQALGDWILYYEPRRASAALNEGGGRSAYFATARVVRIEEDTSRADHFYAFVEGFIEFTHPVPFRTGAFYPESAARKVDGSTSKGALGRAVRVLPRAEYELIVQLGFGEHVEAAKSTTDQYRVAEDPMEYGMKRARILTERAARDAAFGTTIRTLYDDTCALTGLRIINGGGRCETEAAHIRPVAEGGPDSSRNGLTLSRTMNWLFDRGILSLDNEGLILASHAHLPEPVGRLLHASRAAAFPADASRKPHPIYLEYHRNVVCAGKELRRLG